MQVGRFGRAEIINNIFEVGGTISETLLFDTISMFDNFLKQSKQELTLKEAMLTGVLCLKITAIQEAEDIPKSFSSNLTQMLEEKFGVATVKWQERMLTVSDFRRPNYML